MKKSRPQKLQRFVGMALRRWLAACDLRRVWALLPRRCYPLAKAHFMQLEFGSRFGGNIDPC